MPQAWVAGRTASVAWKVVLAAHVPTQKRWASDTCSSAAAASHPTNALDFARPTSQGATCSELWWVTLADRQVLRDVMARKVGAEAAAAELDEFAASKPDGFHVLRIPPGNYHLYSAGAPEIFAETFATQVDPGVVDISLMSPPSFVLTPAPLAPAPTRAMSPRP